VLTEGELDDPAVPVVPVEPVLAVEALDWATVVVVALVADELEEDPLRRLEVEVRAVVVLPGIAQPSAPAVTPAARSATAAVQAVVRLTVLSPASRARARFVWVEVMSGA
jgi:hypothetical protein